MHSTYKFSFYFLFMSSELVETLLLCDGSEGFSMMVGELQVWYS